MYAVAGEAAAHAAGATSFEQLVLDKVIRPLGLTNTGFSQSNMKQHSQNYALSHMAYSFDTAQRGEHRIFPLDEKPYMPLAAALDVYSNVLDLVRWGKVVMDLGAVDGKQVLNRRSVEETLKARSFEWNDKPNYRWLEFDPIFSYGFGWMQDSFCGQRFFTTSKLVKESRRLRKDKKSTDVADPPPTHPPTDLPFCLGATTEKHNCHLFVLSNKFVPLSIPIYLQRWRRHRIRFRHRDLP